MSSDNMQWRYVGSDGGISQSSISYVPSNIIGFITYVQRLSVIEKGHELSTDALGLAVRVRIWIIALKETLGYEGIAFVFLLYPLFVAMSSGVIQIFPGVYKSHAWLVKAFIYLFTFSLNAGFAIIYLWLYTRYAVGPASRMVISSIIDGRFVASILKIFMLTGAFYVYNKILSSPTTLQFFYDFLSTKIDPDTFMNYVNLYKKELGTSLSKVSVIILGFAVMPYMGMLFKRKHTDEIYETDLVIKEGLTHVGKGIKIDKLDSGENTEDIFITFEERHVHEGTVGTTRTGKTVLAQAKILSDIYNGYSVVVIDPKGDEDLKLSVFKATKDTGRLDDFIYISPMFPEISDKVNPFSNYILVEEIVSHLTAPIITDDPFFRNVAKELSLIIAKALTQLGKHSGTREKLTLARIADFCSYDGLKTLRDQHLLPYQDDEELHTVISSINRILKTPPEYFNKVAGNLRTILTALTVGSFAKIISNTTTNRFLERLESGKRVIMYVETASMLDDETSSHFARIMGAMIQTMAGRLLASRKKLNPPLMVHIDEAFKAVYYGIENLFDKGRAANICMSVYFQSVSQFEKVLGEKTTQAILDNINTWTILRLPSDESAEYFSKLSGEKMKFYINFHLDGTVGALSRESTVISPEEILSLPDRYFYLFRMTKGEIWFGKTPTVSLMSKEEKEKIYNKFIEHRKAHTKNLHGAEQQSPRFPYNNLEV